MSAPTYPVRVDALLDGHLSRWVWLVQWPLAFPHYLIVGLFLGGGTFAAGHTGSGLIGISVLIAAVILAVSSSYPVAVFDLVLGLSRWVLRVAAQMPDQYPPFWLDLGDPKPRQASDLLGRSS